MNTLTFLPWARAGAAAALSEKSELGANRARIKVSLNVTRTLDDGSTTVLKSPATGNDEPSLAVSFPMLGPGDVAGIDAGQVVRTEPTDGARGIDTKQLVCVEFDDPTLPWLLTPDIDHGDHALSPWLCLVVVQAQPGVTADRAAGRLTIEPPADYRKELPNLAWAWAWAHVQYAGDLHGMTADAAAKAVSARPTGALSRLLCPRALEERTQYHACIVPTYAAGRDAGLGVYTADADGPAVALAPAWRLDGPAGSAGAAGVFQLHVHHRRGGGFLDARHSAGTPTEALRGRRRRARSHAGHRAARDRDVTAASQRAGAA
jgi:hypothetical protein